MRARSRSNVLSEHVRKHIVPLVHGRIVHLEQARIRITVPRRRRRALRRDGSAVPGALGRRAALPSGAAALEDLLAAIEQHVQLGIADDPALARRRVLHDLDVLALELEQLRSHLRDRLLPRLARPGAAAADRPLELACGGEKGEGRCGSAR